MNKQFGDDLNDLLYTETETVEFRQKLTKFIKELNYEEEDPLKMIYRVKELNQLELTVLEGKEEEQNLIMLEDL
jgi:hypothetical protein